MEQIINRLKPFMFYKEIEIEEVKNEENILVENYDNKPKKIKTLDSVKKLFECFYEMKYETKEVMFKEEKREKFLLSEQIRKFISKGKNKIEQNLIYDNDISIETFGVICELSNLRFIIIKDKMYMEGGKGDKMTVLEKNGKGYKIIEKKCDYKNYWKVENIEKPLKSFSNYKAIELRKIGELLELEIKKTEKKFKTKKEIYEMILQKIS
tara:strand:- start:155 stop:784 length:630 start_codon:yes stop_codon:yes gene_type:complete